MNSIRNDPEFGAFQTVSARAGANPHLVQAAGGNTSIKRDDILWIKASGTWLANAGHEDIFVPVQMSPLMEAFDRKDGSAEKAQDFVVADLNPSGLRPSIETTVHSVIPQKVVLHVHCIATIAHAVLEDAEKALAEKLSGLNWTFIPYVKPGVTLAAEIVSALKPHTHAIILGNHGLVVAGDTVAEAEALMDEVHKRLSKVCRAIPAPNFDALSSLAGGSRYRLPEDTECHGAATDHNSCSIASGGSLYPDHVVFLGVGSTVAEDGETAAEVSRRIVRSGLPEPVSILFPGKGVLLRDDAGSGTHAFARCLADVTARIPADMKVNYLTADQNAELLDWDAEKYRMTLNSAGFAR